MCLQTKPVSAWSGQLQNSRAGLTRYVPFPDCEGTSHSLPRRRIVQVSAMTLPRCSRASIAVTPVADPTGSLRIMYTQKPYMQGAGVDFFGYCVYISGMT